MSSKDSIKNKIRKKSAVSSFLEDTKLADFTKEEMNINKEDHKDVNDGIDNTEITSEQQKKETKGMEFQNEVKQEAEGHSVLRETMNDLTNFDDEPEKVFRGFYFDKDVIDALNNIAEKKKNKKGFKSEFINGIVRSVFEDYGFIKKK